MKFNFSVGIIIAVLLCSCKDDDLAGSENVNNIEPIQNGIVKFEKNVLIKGDLKEESSMLFAKNRSNCKTVSQPLTKFFKSFSTLQPSSDVWPGSIVHKRSVLAGDLKPIIISPQKRNDIEVKLNGLLARTSGAQKAYRIVSNPGSANVQAAIGDILADYFASGTSFPANYTVEIQRVSSASSLEAGLDIGYTGTTGISAGAAFNMNFDTNKAYYAVTLKQEFFTAQVAPLNLEGDHSWYTRDVQSSSIQNSAYVNAVSYGRLYTLLYESNEEGKKVEEALKFAYQTPLSNISASQKAAYASTLKNSNVKIKQFGGDARLGIEVASDFEKIHNFLKEGANVSRSNMPAVIEYKVNDTKTHSSITHRINTKVEYKECNEYSLVLKNVDYDRLPIIFRTDRNYNNNNIHYLESGETIELPYDDSINSPQFTYQGSPIKVIDLNGGNPSDDIKFEKAERVLGKEYPRITYTSKARVGVVKLFDNYRNIVTAIETSADDSDGINGKGPARLIAKKDVENNKLIIEIKRK
ncbi:hypothetical protein D1632_06060 [Chryseobacterium nematophagum]|uniref:Thiol-activated cytolysin n=1 Tax=Chryseobacterium nematophagum TaxID=2305228 RepID=A0A3M7L8V3_9FLAO|nr:thiol-activated cytolysin family protein [Chryseobacterium nematophagum]RMZ59211.1 hypothetical protein D1632_06060 [Chryseobacterium nematophagum]